MESLRLLSGAYIEDNLVVYREEAYSFDEWQRYVSSRKTDRVVRPKRKLWGLPPTTQERLAETREYNRQWMRRFRGTPDVPVAIGSLHGLGCTGPTRALGCRCTKIRCYRRPADTERSVL